MFFCFLFLITHSPFTLKVKKVRKRAVSPVSANPDWEENKDSPRLAKLQRPEKLMMGEKLMLR